jgi:hypothetical protein
MSVRVELWELPGTHWRLPIRVVWHAELAEVRVGAGVRLPACMVKVAEEKLASAGRRMGTNFWLSQANLSKIAKLSTLEDPEEVIEWYPERAPKKVEATYQARDFIMGYCAESYALVKDPLIAEAIYFSFCRFMLHWLVNEEKEVDLVFAKLNALLLRRNWASAAAKHEHIQRGKNLLLKSSYLNPDLQNMVDRGMAHYFVSSSVTAVDRTNKMALYTLDCRQTDEWDRFTRLVEKKRKGAACERYNTSLLVRMKRQLKKVMESYAQYLRETSHPNLLVPVHSIDRVTRQFRIKQCPHELREPPGPWDSSDAVHAAEKQSVDCDVEASDAGVCEVPYIQPPKEDMRDSGI